MREINFGAIAKIREEVIVDWALKNPTIHFSPSTVCNATYKDVYPNNKTPNEVLAAFTIACMDLQHQGILKLEKVLQRKKETVPLYSLITYEDTLKEEESQEKKE